MFYLRQTMPRQTEEQFLSQLLEALDDNSKGSRNSRFQKWFLFFVTVILIAASVVGYKSRYLATSNLMIIAGIAGVSLMGFILVSIIKAQTEMLKPYINAEAIKERIRAIKT